MPKLNLRVKPRPVSHQDLRQETVEKVLEGLQAVRRRTTTTIATLLTVIPGPIV